ncbi:hypothetical protein [Citrobacter koseri]
MKADKALEANNGHDGFWIAHPGLADIAMTVFNEALGETRTSCLLPVMKMRPLLPNSCWRPARAIVPKRDARQYSRGGAVHRSMDLRQWLRTDLWPDGRCGNG